MSGLTGVKCTDQDLVLVALGQAFECSVQQLCDCIHFGECGLTKVEQEKRTHCAALLNKMPNTCTAIRDSVRNDARYAAVMFYERTRLGAAGSGHFLEGLAAGLPLFNGETNLAFLDQDARKLRLRDVVADRIKTVANLGLLPNGSERIESLISN